MYRSQINELLFTRDIAAVKRDLYMNTESVRTIGLINELIGLLALAYQQIIRFFISVEKHHFHIRLCC